MIGGDARWRTRLLGAWRGLPGAAARLGGTAPARGGAPHPPGGEAAPPLRAGGGVVAVTVVGLAGDALERVLDMVQRECATTGAKPVFVTDSHELEPFRRRKLLVDQVVDAEARLAAAPDLPWRLYRLRQYGLMGVRWRPSAVVAFGRRPDEDCLKGLRGVVG